MCIRDRAPAGAAAPTTEAPGQVHFQEAPTRGVDVGALRQADLLPARLSGVAEEDVEPTRAVSAADLGLHLQPPATAPTTEALRPRGEGAKGTIEQADEFEDVPTRALDAREIAQHLTRPAQEEQWALEDEAAHFEDLSTQAVNPNEMAQKHAFENLRLGDFGDDD